MSRYHKSYSLAKVKNRLRAEALKAEDEQTDSNISTYLKRDLPQQKRLF